MNRDRVRSGIVLACVASALVVRAATPRQGTTIDWARADATMTRLLPSRVSMLPAAVRDELNKRGCRIPQPGLAPATTTRNVIRGHFLSPTSEDWAVLCSRARRSAILVFRGGAATHVDELGAADDASYLEAIAPGRAAFSRDISPATAAAIRAHRAETDPRPTLDHDGIDDAFLEKGSTIWFWSTDRWLKLSGADRPSAAAPATAR